MRLALFAAVLGVLALAGVQSFLLFALAIVISGILSYFLLWRQRTEMSDSITRRITGFRSRLDAATRSEDDD
jgi:hypothetical protein